jgi:hypothetical protein
MVEGERAVERVGVAPDLIECGVTEVVVLGLGVAHRDGDEPFGMRHGQRPQHEAVDEREDRRVRADAKRE